MSKYQLPLPMLPSVEPLQRISPALAIGGGVLFFGIYTDIPLVIGSGTVPTVSALPGLCILLLLRSIWSIRMAIFILVPTFLFFILSLFSFDSLEQIFSRINSASQFGYALLLGYVAASVILKMGNDRVHRIVSWILPIFVILILAEIITPFRDISTSYLSFYPRNYDFVAMADRENAMGGYRPKLFTSETSFVAMSSVIIITAYVWSGKNARRYIISLLYTVVLAAIIRSPIVVLSVPIILATAISDRTAGGMRYLYGSALLIVSGVLGLLLMTLGEEIMETRMAKVSSGADYSTTYRTYGALAVGWNVAREYPFFGVGPGSIDSARSIIYQTEIQLGVPGKAVEKDWKVSVNNAIGATLLYFGFIGSFFVCAVTMIFIIGNVPASRVPLLMSMIFLCITSGSIYTPKFVTTLIVLVALAKLRAAVQFRWALKSHTAFKNRRSLSRMNVTS